MKKSFAILFVLITLASFGFAQKANHNFALGDSAFMLDGKPLQIISGEMHCYRIPRAYWRDRIRKAKAMGLNTIGTYIFWNMHEPVEGKYDFSGNSDIAEFVKIAKEEGMWVIMRPSPYACAEWEFGGYPWWLLKDKTLKVRSKDPKFLKAYHDYVMQLGKQLDPLLVTHGGNILMVQIENEYGSYSNDKEYLDINRKLFREAGFDCTLFTCDGPSQMPAGYLPSYLPAVNGLDNPKEVKTLINKYHDGKGPYYIAEWYPGWFDSWGSPHNKSNMDEDAKKLDTVLANGISINMYMFHGGTTRGFMNGANMSKRDPYSPQTSSYDYDAPLDEAGNPTPKYYRFREIIEKHLPAGEKLPPVPAGNKTISIPNIKLTGQHPLFRNLPQPVISNKPLCFEDLSQGYGFVLYRTKIKNATSGLLKIKEMRDFATVYINGKRVAVLDRHLRQDSVQLDNVPANATLDILIENNGRINYGPYLVDNRQGITEKVTLGGTELAGWKMYKLPFNTSPKYTFKQGEAIEDSPVVSSGTFNLAQTGDTYLDMSKFGKGFVFLNGRNIGKYWYIGPQQTLYIPKSWLKVGQNEIVVFDELKGGHTTISALDKPILNTVVKQ
ncbi:glycoside hydrolase family 35 protein [Mucilaginibacter ginsenosidivorans]|uniref:Beta-galactosidase n=1 Tax=Mucilaginibacter ginsenosidivorans TaxID=398053 RepID=A0A5B8UV69_9SPHI|nr:beta-galactosidase family protein [Mucilaginibacter ginsenosidivorans]QEC62954.1 beta-galactosidase [Mucilaginibacter ginsenosidivorans]